MKRKKVNGIVTKSFVKKQTSEVNERIDIVNKKANEIDSKLSNFILETNSGLDEIGRKLEEKDKKDEKRYNKLMEHLVDIAGKFKKFDEEQTVLSDRSRKHEDRIEKIEEAVFKTS